jgi:hypothetical protein
LGHLVHQAAHKKGMQQFPESWLQLLLKFCIFAPGGLYGWSLLCMHTAAPSAPVPLGQPLFGNPEHGCMR